MKQIKETLYGEPKGGKAKQWSVYVNANVVTVEWGRVGGKLQTKDTICSPKNVGKANETTSEEQAILEATAKWEKQYTNKLYRHTVAEAQIVGELLPMLAIDGSKKPEKIKFPCDHQPKLDGVRCMVYLDEDSGGVKAISRQGKFYDLHPILRDELHTTLKENKINKLDGELYIHGNKLQDIVSAVRNTKNPMWNKVEFHVFDIPHQLNWESRKQLLKEYKSQYVKTVPIGRADDLDSLNLAMHHYMSQGYEGAMARNLNGKYEFNHRSNDLIKLKVMQDSEALVVNCREDKNGEGVLACEWGGVTFECKMKGGHSERVFSEQQKLIGLWINFKYQALTKDGKPQFPVGLYVRECDSAGNPIN